MGRAVLIPAKWDHLLCSAWRRSDAGVSESGCSFQAANMSGWTSCSPNSGCTKLE
jgi:hypothetical protein